MDLNEVVVFAKVVDAGSFTGAARALRMPKSTVSRKVAELEERLGARLIHRTTRKLKLTEVGQAYYQRAARVIVEVEEAELQVAEMQSVPRGLLRITAPLNFRELGPIVASFQLRYPEVRVEVVCTDRVVDLIEEGFDIAVRAGRLTDSTSIGRNLGAIRSVLVASPAFVERHGEPTTIDDLHHFDCLAFGAGRDPSWKLVRDGTTSIVDLDAKLVANDFEVLHEAALCGLGIALLPIGVCGDDLEHGRLQRLMPAWYSPEVPLQAVYPSNRQLSSKARAFLDHLLEHAPEPT